MPLHLHQACSYHHSSSSSLCWRSFREEALPDNSSFTRLRALCCKPLVVLFALLTHILFFLPPSSSPPPPTLECKLLRTRFSCLVYHSFLVFWTYQAHSRLSVNICGLRCPRPCASPWEWWTVIMNTQVSDLSSVRISYWWLLGQFPFMCCLSFDETC